MTEPWLSLLTGGNLFLGVFLAAVLFFRVPTSPASRWLAALVLACTLNAAHPAVMELWGVIPGSGQLFEPLQFLLPHGHA